MKQRRRLDGTAFLTPPGVWLLLFFVLPMLSMVLFSVWRTVDYKLVASFTLENYERLAGSLYVNVFWRTLRISLYVTLLMLLVLPLWTSYLVRTYAWMLILGTNGVINQSLRGLGLIEQPISWLLYSDFAVTIALVHIYMPYLVLPLYAVLEKVDGSLLEAARDLGGGRWRTFWHVTLPLSLPGIATGCLFVFIPSMGAFVTPELLGGTRSILIGSIIAQQFGVSFQYPFGSAMSLVLMAVILAFAVVALRYGRPAGST